MSYKKGSVWLGGVGGVLIWNHSGSWIRGFTHFIGMAFRVEAELWTPRNGLMLCISLNLLAFELELDANVVLGWVFGNLNSNLHHASLIMDCRSLINQIPQVKMKHYFCEVNKCVDFLAKRGSSSSHDLLLFDSSPMNIYMLLFYDNVGLYYERQWLCTLDLFSFC